MNKLAFIFITLASSFFVQAETFTGVVKPLTGPKVKIRTADKDIVVDVSRISPVPSRKTSLNLMSPVPSWRLNRQRLH